jgi:pyrophosphatase PpaX
MRYSTILLDWDGCLANTLSVWMRTYLSVYKEYGYDLTPAEIIDKSWGNTDQGPLNIGITDNQACWERIVAQVKDGVAQVPLYEHAKELLQVLHESGLNLAIVTSSERKVVQPALQFHDIEKYIDILVTDNDVSKPKPDPEMLFKAMDHFKSIKKGTFIIGDTDKDIFAGQRASIDTGLVLHEANKTFYDFEKLKKSNPTQIFLNLSEVLQFIQHTQLS